MPLTGTRENPLHVTKPGDVKRATRHVHRPSPEQASAGNYHMAHVMVQGLPITIETPIYCLREGIAPDGTPWSVSMPADYGYVKRTKGADGDHVDVYLGDWVHEAHTHPVWVVDQCDADSREFDEHKVMLGFPHSDSARDTYLAAFSDGRGRERIGAVTRMDFDTFVEWLENGDTQNPLTYRSTLRKSASRNGGSNTYGKDTCPCATCRGTHGGFMPKTIEAKAAANPRETGFIAKWLGKAIGNMPAADQAAMLQDASVLGLTEIGKAERLLEHGDDGVRHLTVEDQWDGAPDDEVKVVHAHGPDSKVKSGDVPVGPGQSSSGNGAESMEREYSRPTPQNGVQRATERLGKDIMTHRAAMKSIVEAMGYFNTQVELLKSSTTLTTDLTAIEAAVNAAVAKAVPGIVAKAIKDATPGIVAKALAKAKESGKEDKAEEDEEEDDEAVMKAEEPSDKVDITTEVDDDDDDKDDDKANEAAKARLLAKSYLKWAARRVRRGTTMAEDGNRKAASRALAMARSNIAKAASHLEMAKSLRTVVGPSTKAIDAAIAKAKKDVASVEAENQKKWPDSEDNREASKSAETVVAQTAPAVTPDLAKAMDEIKRAAEGMGMLTATVGEFMSTMNRGGNGGGGNNLPPVFALAKAQPGVVSAREAELIQLRDTNVISFDDHENARNVIGRIRMGLPADTISAMMSRLPEAAQAVLNRAA